MTSGPGAAPRACAPPHNSLTSRCLAEVLGEAHAGCKQAGVWMPARSVSTARTSLDSHGHPFCKDSLPLPCQIPSPHSSQGHLEQSLGGWASQRWEVCLFWKSHTDVGDLLQTWGHGVGLGALRHEVSGIQSPLRELPVYQGRETPTHSNSNSVSDGTRKQRGQGGPCPTQRSQEASWKQT